MSKATPDPNGAGSTVPEPKQRSGPPNTADSMMTTSSNTESTVTASHNPSTISLALPPLQSGLQLTPPPGPPGSRRGRRPGTSARGPSRRGRPNTGMTSSSRPDTSRLGTASSVVSNDSLSDLPGQEFAPDYDEDDYISEEGEEEEYDSEEEPGHGTQDVFAFGRPTTAAPGLLGAGNANANASLRPGTRQGTAPGTAGTFGPPGTAGTFGVTSNTGETPLLGGATDGSSFAYSASRGNTMESRVHFPEEEMRFGESRGSGRSGGSTGVESVISLNEPEENFTPMSRGNQAQARAEQTQAETLASVDSLPYTPYGNSKPGQMDRHGHMNPNASAYTVFTDNSSNAQHQSSVNSSAPLINPQYPQPVALHDKLRNQFFGQGRLTAGRGGDQPPAVEPSREASTKISHQPSLLSQVSFGGTSITDSMMTDDERRDFKGSYEMGDITTTTLNDPDGQYRRNRRDKTGSRGTWNTIEIEGTVTVPDGMTTRGDGNGALYPKSKWAMLEDENGIEGGGDDMEEDSPYEEVRASVSNIDDPDMPILTIRSLFIGISLTIAGSAINTFFRFRNPAPAIPPMVAQLLAYPIGVFMAWALPLKSFNAPKWLGGFEIDLNPGPFNIKEHTVIVIMANVALGTNTGLQVAAAAKVYLELDFGDSFSIFFMLAAQMGGFGLAGLSRQLLVWPASMIWPYNLIITTNLNTFHAEADANDKTMTRFKFFMIAFSCAFGYYFFPGFLMTCLSYFSWICWMKPDNVIVNQLFGVSSGLGFGILTFDWAQVGYIGNPLNVPWWAQVNFGVSFVIFYWMVCPLLYYANVWYTAYLPMSYAAPFDRFGGIYNISRIMTEDHRFDAEGYENYSPVYIPVTFAMTFTIAFGLTTAAIVHPILHHGKRLVKTWKTGKGEKDDIHMKLMRQYPEVPYWWFIVVLVACFVFGVIAVEVAKTGFPVYALVVAVVIPTIYFIPAGFLYATASQLLAVNLIAELIPGYMLKGSILGNMIAKSYSTQALYGAVQFTQDMKLGHYMKIPPRVTFVVQIMATLIACFASYAVQRILFAVVPDLCSPFQANLLTCPYTRTYYTSGILWGAIGPHRLFGARSLYWGQTFALIGGALLPIPFWWLGRRYPKSILRKVDFPVALNGVLGMPPATGVNYASFLAVGFVFQYVIKKRNFAWWAKYNYVLAAALDVGTLLSGIFIFLILGLPGVSLDWGGNNIYTKTADWMGLTYRLPPETGFGPDSGWK